MSSQEPLTNEEVRRRLNTLLVLQTEDRGRTANLVKAVKTLMGMSDTLHERLIRLENNQSFIGDRQG